MAVGYKLIEKKNLSTKEGEPRTKFYAIPSLTGQTDTKAICDLISVRSAVSSADVKAVLDNLVFVFHYELSQGRTVDLDRFASFRISFSGEGVETKKQFHSGLIRNIRLLFTPHLEIKGISKKLTFTSAQSAEEAAAALALLEENAEEAAA